MNEDLRNKLREFLFSATAIRESMEQSVRADVDSAWKYTAYKQYARKYNQIAERVVDLLPTNVPIDIFAVDKIPGPTNTIGIQQKELFEAVHANLSIIEAFLRARLDMRKDEVESLRNFMAVSLRRAVFRPPAKEREVQDAVEGLLIGRGLSKGVDYDREVGRVKVSIKEMVPDFIFPKLGLALEIKLSKNNSKARAIVDEINADIRGYGKSYRSILFVVYDLGSIRDEAEFAQDLEAADGVGVVVVKH